MPDDSFWDDPSGLLNDFQKKIMETLKNGPDSRFAFIGGRRFDKKAAYDYFQEIYRKYIDQPPAGRGKVEWIMIGVRKPDGEVVIAASTRHEGDAQWVEEPRLDYMQQAKYLQLRFDIFDMKEAEGVDFNDAFDVLIGLWDPDDLPQPEEISEEVKREMFREMFKRNIY